MGIMLINRSCTKIISVYGSKVNYSDLMHRQMLLNHVSSATKKMSVLSLAQILRSYFLFSIVGFGFISDEGEWLNLLIIIVATPD